MSNPVAFSTIGRLHMAPIAVAEHHVSGLQSELHSFLQADPDKMAAQFSEMKNNLCMAYGLGESRSDKPFAFSNGLAVIPIHGTLINRFGASWGFVTGYNFLRSQALAAKSDPDVKGIVFDVNSSGGEVAGCQETADVIASLRGVKPTLAVVDSRCYSAAYWTASAADKMVVTPSGGAGSIGAMAMHVNFSKALENEGVQVTLLHAGAHKVDGNPYQELSEDARESLQASLDDSRNAFAGAVSQNRGIALQTVMGTEARCYDAKQAKELGLVDEIANPQAAVTSFFNFGTTAGANGAQATSNNEEPTMDPTNDNQQAQTFTAADVAAARTEGATAERARISAIMTAEVATGREALANHFAFNTDMSVESAVAALTVSPKAVAAPPQEAAAPENAFANAMNTSDNPNIPAGGEEVEPSAEQKAQASVDSFFAARELLTGRKAK